MVQMIQTKQALCVCVYFKALALGQFVCRPGLLRNNQAKNNESIRRITWAIAHLGLMSSPLPRGCDVSKHLSSFRSLSLQNGFNGGFKSPLYIWNCGTAALVWEESWQVRRWHCIFILVIVFHSFLRCLMCMPDTLGAMGCDESLKTAAR